MIEQRTHDGREVFDIGPIDLRRDLEGDAGLHRDADRRIRLLLGRDAAEEDEVTAGRRVKSIKVRRQPVVHGGRPADAGERGALRVAHRDEPDARGGTVHGMHLGEIEPTVEGQQGGHPAGAGKREAEVVGVAVDHVELGGAVVDLEQHAEVEGDGIVSERLEPEPPARTRHELRTGQGVAAREEGHVVTALDEPFGQIGDHAFRPAVALRRNALVERRNLGDTKTHHTPP